MCRLRPRSAPARRAIPTGGRHAGAREPSAQPHAFRLQRAQEPAAIRARTGVRAYLLRVIVVELPFEVEQPRHFIEVVHGLPPAVAPRIPAPPRSASTSRN